MNYIDYGIVIVFFVSMIVMGFYYKKSKAGTDYFLGGKSFGWFSLCMSAMATQLSAVSFVSAPAFVGLRQGGGMHWLTYEFGVPLAMIIIITFIGPALHRSGAVSAYSLLEKRFGVSTRLLLSSVFLISRSFATGVVIYTVCLILSSITGIAFWQTMLILAFITILYSLEGGMKAVVYSEVAQMIIKFLGILLIGFLALNYLGGWSRFLEVLDRNRLQVLNFSSTGFDKTEFGFWPMLFGGIFLYTAYYGTDQTQAQRILSAKDELTVKRLLLFNGLFRFPITLAYCFGGLALGAFVSVTPSFAAMIPAEKPDLMVPTFINHYVPHGIVGILVVALIAAGMSAYSSTLNSLSAITMEDFISRKRILSEAEYVRWSKVTALVWGVVTMILAFYVGGIAKTVIEAINKISSMFYGPVLAVFLMAFITKRIGGRAANIGLIIGVLVNLIMWLWFKEIFWFWWNFIGCFITVSVASLIQLVSGKYVYQPTDDRSAFVPAPKETAILITYLILILIFCYCLPKLFN